MLIFLKTVEGQSRCGTLGLVRLRTSETRPGVIRAGPFRSREREWAAPRAKAAPSRGKARNRRLAHVVRTRNVGLRFPISKPRKGFLTLMTVEGRLAAETHALGLRTGSAVAGAGENHRSLELRQGRVIAERGLTRCPGRSSISTIRVRKHEGGLFLIAVKGLSRLAECADVWAIRRSGACGSE